MLSATLSFMSVHMIKLVVGSDSLEDFALWQQQGAERVIFDGINGEQEANIVRTRYKPKRADEILSSGGSIYRIIKGRICCRQQIVGFDTYESADKGTQCLILTDTKIIQTQSSAHRPFQGWRYFDNAKAPHDRGEYIAGKIQNEVPPPEIEEALKGAGLL
tara:strand:+ start:174 stop:656 length:483 start_codon:yes stop_codon:yes gene_type:complete